jgi:hypothetical protein
LFDRRLGQPIGTGAAEMRSCISTLVTAGSIRDSPSPCSPAL